MKCMFAFTAVIILLAVACGSSPADNPPASLLDSTEPTPTPLGVTARPQTAPSSVQSTQATPRPVGMPTASSGERVDAASIDADGLPVFFYTLDPEIACRDGQCQIGYLPVVFLNLGVIGGPSTPDELQRTLVVLEVPDEVEFLWGAELAEAPQGTPQELLDSHVFVKSANAGMSPTVAVPGNVAIWGGKPQYGGELLNAGDNVPMPTPTPESRPALPAEPVPVDVSGINFVLATCTERYCRPDAVTGGIPLFVGPMNENVYYFWDDHFRFIRARTIVEDTGYSVILSLDRNEKPLAAFDERLWAYILDCRTCLPYTILDAVRAGKTR